MYYNDKSAEVVKEGKWDEKSCVRRIGGYDIDKSSLPASMKYLPKGAVMALVSATGKAKLVKTAIVYETAESAATSVKVAKGHALVVGDTIANKAISAIEEGADFDTLTVAALSAKLTKDTVVTNYANNDVILGLNYATVKIDDYPSCTPTLQAYEIEEDTLPFPITSAIKEALTVRHAFKI